MEETRPQNHTPRDLDSGAAMPSNEMMRRSVPRFMMEPDAPSTSADGAGTAIVDTQQPKDPLAELARLISEPPRAPQQGIDAGQKMVALFEQLAIEIEGVANDAMRRAQEFHAQATSYASTVRKSGALLCEDLENDAARLRQFHVVMQEARRVFGEFSTRPAPGQ